MSHKLYKIGSLLLLLTGCSTQAWYDGMQQQNKLDCLKNPTTRIETCQQTGQPYDNYKRDVDNIR